mgnify:CR=1 FL=1
MAEGFVNAVMGDEWEAVSAGTHPEKEVNPYAIRALAELGIQHNGTPKLADQFRGEHLDLVITVCDDAAERCPIWLGEGKKVHKGFPDPAKAQGPDEEVLAVYRETLEAIKTKIPPILAAY